MLQKEIYKFIYSLGHNIKIIRKVQIKRYSLLRKRIFCEIKDGIIGLDCFTAEVLKKEERDKNNTKIKRDIQR